MSFFHRHRSAFLRTLAGGVVGGGFIFVSGAAFVVSGFGGTAHLPADCAIVFGAAVHPKFDNNGKVVPESQAGPGILRRVNTAVKLYQQGLISKLYMSGGRGQGMRQSEAEVMGDLAVSEGVKPEDIVLEAHSKSTEENLLLTRPLTGSCQTVVGISDRYHLARIGYLANRQGWELSTVPAQGMAPVIFEAQSVIREIGALVMYTIKDLLT